MVVSISKDRSRRDWWCPKGSNWTKESYTDWILSFLSYTAVVTFWLRIRCRKDCLTAAAGAGAAGGGGGRRSTKIIVCWKVVGTMWIFIGSRQSSKRTRSYKLFKVLQLRQLICGDLRWFEHKPPGYLSLMKAWKGHRTSFTDRW